MLKYFYNTKIKSIKFSKEVLLRIQNIFLISWQTGFEERKYWITFFRMHLKVCLHIQFPLAFSSLHCNFYHLPWLSKTLIGTNSQALQLESESKVWMDWELFHFFTILLFQYFTSDLLQYVRGVSQIWTEFFLHVLLVIR